MLKVVGALMKSPGGRLSTDPNPNNEKAAKQWRRAGQSDGDDVPKTLVSSPAIELVGSRAGAKTRHAALLMPRLSGTCVV